jgi:mannose-6-phosphate isomerase class I
MNFKNINSKFIGWDKIEPVETKGETGFNTSKEFHINNIRIMMSEYSANYKSSAWCNRGHIIYCVDGEMNIILKDKENFNLRTGDSLILAENDSHIAVTGAQPAKIFIVD